MKMPLKAQRPKPLRASVARRLRERQRSPGKGAEPKRALFSAYLALVLSLLNGVYLVQDVLLGPEVRIYPALGLTIYGQSCFKDPYLELIFPVAFYNLASRNQQGIVTDLSLRFVYRGSTLDFIPEYKAKIFDSDELFPVKWADDRNIAGGKSRYCPPDFYSFKGRKFQYEEDYVISVVGGADVTVVNIGFTPTDWDKRLLLDERAINSLFDSLALGTAYADIAFNIRNDGILDRFTGRSTKIAIKCTISNRYNYKDIFRDQGWVDLTLGCGE